MSTGNRAHQNPDAVDRTLRRFRLAREVLSQASADRCRAVRKMREWQPGRPPAEAHIAPDETGHAAR